MSASLRSKRPMSEVATERSQQAKRVMRSNAAPIGAGQDPSAASQGPSAASQGTEEDNRARDRDRAIRKSERHADIIELENFVQDETDQVLEEVGDLNDSMRVRLNATETRLSRIEVMLRQLLAGSPKPQEGTAAPAAQQSMGSTASLPSGAIQTPSPKSLEALSKESMSDDQRLLIRKLRDLRFEGDYDAFNNHFRSIAMAAQPDFIPFRSLEELYLGHVPPSDRHIFTRAAPKIKTMRDLYFVSRMIKFAKSMGLPLPPPDSCPEPLEAGAAPTLTQTGASATASTNAANQGDNESTSERLSEDRQDRASTDGADAYEETMRRPLRVLHLMALDKSLDSKLDRIRHYTVPHQLKVDDRLEATEDRLTHIESMLEKLLADSKKRPAGTAAPPAWQASRYFTTSPFFRAAQAPSRQRTGPASQAIPWGLIRKLECLNFNGDYVAYERNFRSLVQTADPSSFPYAYLKECYLMPLPHADRIEIEKTSPDTVDKLCAQSLLYGLGKFTSFFERFLELKAEGSWSFATTSLTPTAAPPADTAALSAPPAASASHLQPSHSSGAL